MPSSSNPSRCGSAAGGAGPGREASASRTALASAVRASTRHARASIPPNATTVTAGRLRRSMVASCAAPMRGMSSVRSTASGATPSNAASAASPSRTSPCARANHGDRGRSKLPRRTTGRRRRRAPYETVPQSWCNAGPSRRSTSVSALAARVFAAKRAASPRECKPSFRSIRPTWVLTVCGLRWSSEPMRSLSRPRPNRASTSASRTVRRSTASPAAGAARSDAPPPETARCGVARRP